MRGNWTKCRLLPPVPELAANYKGSRLGLWLKVTQNDRKESEHCEHHLYIGIIFVSLNFARESSEGCVCTELCEGCSCSTCAWQGSLLASCCIVLLHCELPELFLDIMNQEEGFCVGTDCLQPVWLVSGDFLPLLRSLEVPAETECCSTSPVSCPLKFRGPV